MKIGMLNADAFAFVCELGN